MLSSQTGMLQYAFISTQLQKELAVRQLFDFINGKWYCAGIWFDTLVDEGVNADTEFMIWIVLCLPWCQLRHNYQPRDAARIRAELYNGRAG